MSTARHMKPKELEGLSLEEIMQRHVGRFTDKTPDWAAFEDAKIEGYRRAQRGFTLSIMEVPPGQGNAAHTHEVEEVFFVLKGSLSVFVEDESGRRLSRTLGPWECISCPPGVIHGYQNESSEPVFFQVMLGKARPETMGYADDSLYQRRDAHLK